MLQRSPSYMASLPSEDPLAGIFRSFAEGAALVIRWKIFSWVLSFTSSVAGRLASRSGCSDVTSRKSFRPISTLTRTSSRRTSPSGPCVCLVPDADLFQAIKAGRVSIVTDQIIRFTTNGIRLKSGQELPADIIVTATGLNLLACGGIRISVDGLPVELGRAIAYKGVMLNHVPNCALCVGYTNASWTLRADSSCEYVCRLLNYMERHGYKQCVPCIDDATVEPQPLLGLKSGYVCRRD